jgi:hypothetical protein
MTMRVRMSMLKIQSQRFLLTMMMRTRILMSETPVYMWYLSTLTSPPSRDESFKHLDQAGVASGSLTIL